MHPLRQMAILSIATSCLTIALKFGAYFLTESVSLLSDALEAFVNLAAGLVAYGALTIAERPADAGHAYGHEKAEYFASGVEGALILIAAVSIVVAAVARLLNPVPLEGLGPGIAVALVAAAANYAAARVMLRVAKAHDSIVIESDAKHLLTDVWTSIGVVAGLLIVWWVPQWHVLDPLVAIAVALHIVHTGLDLLRRSVSGLMDAALPGEEVRAITEVLNRTSPPGVTHNTLRTRKAGSRRFVEFNLGVPGGMTVHDAHAICDSLEHALGCELANISVTIHVEPRLERAGPGSIADS